MLGTHLGYAAAYAAVGFGILILGFWVLDLLTPGKLGTKIFDDGSYSAAIVAAANLFGLGLIVFTAVWTNATAGFGTALEWTVVFGLVGVGLLAVAFVILDLLTPGKLGDFVCLPGKLDPPALLTAASQLAVAGIICAAIA